MRKGERVGSGTAQLTKTFIAASHERKSLPTQVHVRPSNINCNSLRSDFSLTKFNPTILIGNWNEQRTFDGINSVDTNIKPKGVIFNEVGSVHHDRKCPPTMGGVEPRYMTESRIMSKWLPPMDEKLPDINTCCDTIGKPLHADADASLYTTSSSYIGGGDQQVRFH
mmetsp:Transcript_39384/g.63490  ORF Transcript_39384/g.63490 Transcript_39384/m.63490 type:complete len:167 (-) Transcript_39384:133-633(-)